MQVLYKSGETVNIQNGQYRRKLGRLISLRTSNAQAVTTKNNQPTSARQRNALMMCAGLYGNIQKHWIKSRCDNISLEDVIYQISPVETPFFTMAKRTTARAVLHE